VELLGLYLNRLAMELHTASTGWARIIARIRCVMLC
jgi:hypothetical protein